DRIRTSKSGASVERDGSGSARVARTIPLMPAPVLAAPASSCSSEDNRRSVAGNGKARRAPAARDRLLTRGLLYQPAQEENRRAVPGPCRGSVLEDEVGNDAVDRHAVEVLLPGELDEVGDRQGRLAAGEPNRELPSADELDPGLQRLAGLRHERGIVGRSAARLVLGGRERGAVGAEGLQQRPAREPRDK